LAANDVTPRSARPLEPGRDMATSMSIAERYAPFTFVHVSRSVTMRLKLRALVGPIADILDEMARSLELIATRAC
jgi:hypothetical protein